MMERGSVGPLTLVLVLLVCVSTLAAGWWAGAVGLRHRAGAAADLAAIAAAQAWVGGTGPCEAADRLATANGAHLVQCSIQSGAVRIRVRVERRLGVLGHPLSLHVEREAWAGPAQIDSAVSRGRAGAAH